MPAGHRAAAQGFASIEIAADLWAALVNGAELGGGIECDARTVAVLIHAADASVFDHELFRHVVEQRREFDEEVAAFAAGGAKRKIVGRE